MKVRELLEQLDYNQIITIQKNCAQTLYKGTVRQCNVIQFGDIEIEKKNIYTEPDGRLVIRVNG